MGSLNRKMKRKKLREAKKISKSATNSVENSLSALPTACTSCGVSFDKNDFSIIDEWKITIEPGSFSLTCPKCS